MSLFITGLVAMHRGLACAILAEQPAKLLLVRMRAAWMYLRAAFSSEFNEQYLQSINVR